MLSKKDTTKLLPSVKDILDSIEPDSNTTITDLYYDKVKIDLDCDDKDELNYKQKEITF